MKEGRPHQDITLRSAYTWRHRYRPRTAEAHGFLCSETGCTLSMLLFQLGHLHLKINKHRSLKWTDSSSLSCLRRNEKSRGTLPPCVQKEKLSMTRHGSSVVCHWFACLQGAPCKPLSLVFLFINVCLPFATQYSSPSGQTTRSCPAS